MTPSDPSYPSAAGAPPTPMADSPAKRPRTRLAGPYGHPIHPIMVTVPIGAWVCSLVFDLASRTGTEYEPDLARGAFLLLCIGIVTALLASVFGTMDLMAIPARTKAASTAVAHLALNTAVVGLMAVNVLIRKDQGLEQVGLLPLGLSVFALVVLGLSGYLGGKLAYHYGVRVAAERDQVAGYERTADPVREPGQGA